MVALDPGLDHEKRCSSKCVDSVHQCTVSYVAWSPDGTCLASGSVDKTVRTLSRAKEGLCQLNRFDPG